MNELLIRQIDDVKRIFNDAEITEIGGTAAVVTIPNFPLGPGWSATKTTVRFVVPAGYPVARPDCFWTDADLRLVDSKMPQATNFQALPSGGEALLWFSWHAGQWNPNQDSLLTYINVIRTRLKEPR
jgi:hypothetical protein